MFGPMTSTNSRSSANYAGVVESFDAIARSFLGLKSFDRRQRPRSDLWTLSVHCYFSICDDQS